MKNNNELIETLNDLVRINNDRITGYERAAELTRSADVDLATLFRKMADESRTYKGELQQEVAGLGGKIATDTTASGKIYRAWMSVKNMFTGSDRKSILASCEFGEDAVQKAYQHALISDQSLSIDIRKFIENQKESLKASHDTIKRFRDLQRQSESDDIINSNNLRNSKDDLRRETSVSDDKKSGSGSLRNL